jgi:hypothetical protein
MRFLRVASAEYRPKIASPGIEKAIAAMLAHADHAGLQKAACGLLYNLAVDGEAHRLRIHLIEADSIMQMPTRRR